MGTQIDVQIMSKVGSSTGIRSDESEPLIFFFLKWVFEELEMKRYLSSCWALKSLSLVQSLKFCYKISR